MLPKENHNENSLEYFEKFIQNDDDVIAITYPKSGKDKKYCARHFFCGLIICIVRM